MHEFSQARSSAEVLQSYLRRLLRTLNSMKRVRAIVGGASAQWAVLAVALAATLGVATQQLAASEERARLRFVAHANEVRHALQQRVDAYMDLLSASRALFGSSTKVTRDEWAAFVSSLNPSERFPESSACRSSSGLLEPIVTASCRRCDRTRR